MGTKDIDFPTFLREFLFRFFNLQKAKENNRQIQKRYLVSGYFREDIHNDLQNIVNESLFELFVFSPSVVHFVILPLLKPLVVGEADQTHGGLAWCGKKNKTIRYSESCMNLALLYTLRHVTCFCTWWSFLPGRIFSRRGADEQERYAFSRIFPLSVHVLLNPVKENSQTSNSKKLSEVENSCRHGYFSDAVDKITKVVFLIMGLIISPSRNSKICDPMITNYTYCYIHHWM